MRPAPVADLLGEVLLHQMGNRVHIGQANAGAQVAVKGLFPQKRQILAPFRPKGFAQCFRHAVAPGMILHLPDGLAAFVKMPIAQLRFIRKESSNGGAKIGLIMRPVRFIHRIDQPSAGGCRHHVDIIPVRPAIPGQVQDMQLPLSLRHLETQRFLPECLVQVDQILLACTMLFDGDQADQLVIIPCAQMIGIQCILLHHGKLRRLCLCVIRQGKLQPFAAGGAIDRLTDETLPAQFCGSIHHCAGRVSCRKMAVIQNPQLHPQ